MAAPLALLLALFACAPKQGDTGDTLGGTDTGSEDPWHDPDYWLASSLLDRVLDMDQAPREAHYEVVLCLSSVGFGVDMSCEILAHTISSLDLLAVESGLIMLGGLDLLDWGDYYDEGGRHLYALTTPDLQRWGTHLWEIEETTHPSITDASLEVLPDGSVRAVYVSGMATSANPHDIRVAHRDGERWTEQEGTIYQADDLLDPKGCSFDGSHHLFATGQSSEAVVHATGTTPDAYQTDGAFQGSGAQVPFCMEHEDELWLVSQTGGGWGPPMHQTLQPDGSFSQPRPLWDSEDYPELSSCTSPVLQVFQETYVVVCAVYRP